MGASLEDEVYTVYISEEAFMDWDRVIYNGTVVNDNVTARADIYSRDGRVAAVTSERLPCTVGEATDASRRYILPGLI